MAIGDGFLEEQEQFSPPEQREINEINEKEFLKSTRKRNKRHLVRLDILERERVAHKIKEFYNDAKTKHEELEDDIDRYDEIYRMERDSRPGESNSDAPNYRTPLSTVTLEVIHANLMNVFFTPKDTMRVLPTEAGDIGKVNKLELFGNWSMKNEMELFDQCDRLFHASGKNGEAPYMVHWVKEYGIEIKIEPVMNPMQPDEPLFDPNTKEVITQEREIEKILYNGPRLEVFSRKDYIRPRYATANKVNQWDMRRLRITADEVNRKEMEGEFYTGTFDEIGGWNTGVTNQEDMDNRVVGKDGDTIPLGPTEKMFVEFYGRLRVKAMKEDIVGGQDDDVLKELEDEFIAVVELRSETLCSFRKNRFPLKMRPIGIDEFIPDDEGRKQGIGIMEFMDSIQKSFDSLHNQYLLGTIQANSPIVFFSPTGNQRDEPIKLQHGYAYPSADPGSVKEIKLSAPDHSLVIMMEQVRNFAQLLFGISDYAAGIESQIDPSAPAKKAELVVAQGNVRLNLIIKRKNKTLQDIFKRWFLLYQANMPPNKFMRIAGEESNNPWKFEAINITDFALKSLPDFELVGNVLNANKTLEIQKALATYQVLIANPFFAPNTQQGLQSLHALTKWLLDKMDEVGISQFLPSPEGELINTPEEENARMIQGDEIEPSEGEDHVKHMRVHSELILDESVPEDVRKLALEHNQRTAELLKKQITQQLVVGGQPNVPQGQPNTVTPQSVKRPVQQPGLGGPQIGNLGNIQ